jgi:hypothetical protein
MKIWIALAIALITVTAAHGIVSMPGGFYNDSIEFSLSMEEGHYALYTLNGSDPRAHGIMADGTIIIEKRDDAPSELAVNPNITLWSYTPPQSTLKATPLRIVVYDGESNEVSEHISTYFIGLSHDNFKVPVFSVVINPEYLDDYDIGMYIKGRLYDESVEAGRNPLNPFIDANWNSRDLRWPSHYELYDNGDLMISDVVRLQTSGRWSSALPMKSWKISYRYDVSETSYPFFDNDTTDPIKTIRFRSGSQDMDSGITMRDCVAALIFDGSEAEMMNCRAMVLFLNGEFWGAYNMREDSNDNRHYAYKYGLPRSDIVALEMDGIVDGGEPGDNIPYLNLRDWLMMEGTDLSDDEAYANLTAQVNPVSLIDYHVCHAFFGNKDFPNDHYFWRNKNPESQVPGTPYDGRWQYHCKDVDQSMGLYSRPDGNHLPDYNWIGRHLFSEEMEGWHTLFIRKAFENSQFRQLFYERNEFLLDDFLNPERTARIVNDYRGEKEPVMQMQIDRWSKPSNIGSWHNNVDGVIDWLAQRHMHYGAHIAEIRSMHDPSPQDPTDPPEDPIDPPEEPVCYESVTQIPASCEGGTITTEETIPGGGKKVICEQDDNLLEITAWDKEGGQYYEMYKQQETGTGITICLANECISISGTGFKQSEPYPICT